jgi:hypothetical protein
MIKSGGGPTSGDAALVEEVCDDGGSTKVINLILQYHYIGFIYLPKEGEDKNDGVWRVLQSGLRKTTR